MNFRQFQLSIWHTLDCKEITNYTNMVVCNLEYKQSKLWLLCCYFCYCHLMYLSHKLHILIIFYQVVCRSIFKCRLLAKHHAPLTLPNFGTNIYVTSTHGEVGYEVEPTLLKASKVDGVVRVGIGL